MSTHHKVINGTCYVYETKEIYVGRCKVHNKGKDESKRTA
jgi:hypothetical protein